MKYTRRNAGEFGFGIPKLPDNRGTRALGHAWNWGSNGLNLYATYETAKSLLARPQQPIAMPEEVLNTMPVEKKTTKKKYKSSVSSKNGEAYNLDNWNG